MARRSNPVIDEILRQGRNQPRRRILAALATGRVESNFRNLPGGDADSQGWRQERASLYRDPRNLSASVRRFYQEAAKLDRGQPVGVLAADVQRPAAQYRGRYAEHLDEARQILGGGGAGGTGDTDSRARTRTTTTTTTPGVDNRRARAQLVQAFLEDKGADVLDFAMQARALRDIPATRSSRTSYSGGGGGGGGGRGGGAPRSGSSIKELFWQGPGGINLKNGRRVPQGFVSGHTDHVHVAAGPKTVDRFGRMAQRMGLHVGENPDFGGVDPVHAPKSFHYSDRAIDVSGDPRLERRFARRVYRYQRRRRR